MWDFLWGFGDSDQADKFFDEEVFVVSLLKDLKDLNIIGDDSF